MILHLRVECDRYRSGTRSLNPRPTRAAINGFASEPAEIGRGTHILACQRRDAKSIVTYLDGILT